MSFAVVDEVEAQTWQPRVAMFAETNTKLLKLTPAVAETVAAGV